MIVEKKIELGNKIYYISVEVEYKTKDGIIQLCLKNYNDDYYDGGDFSNLLNFVKENHNFEISNKYNTGIGYLDDVLYLYNHIPFLSSIRDVYQNEKESFPSLIGFISKEELDKFIKENGIKMHDNSKFKLFDERTWKI